MEVVIKKTLLLSLIAIIIVLFFAFGLDRFLTLEALKASHSSFNAMWQESPWTVASLYFVMYVGVTALSLPGAVIMTLAGGALFGLWTGVLIISFASSIGATLAFLVARYVLRDAVQKSFGDKLTAINAGIAKDGALYLFSLRLVPLFPFFLINLLMGLTTIPTVTFYWVSQVGMLAGTVVYVNAGTQLATIHNLADIASPELLLSFTLLGIFPLIAKRFVMLLQKRRLYARWSPPKQYDRNLVVIGAGAAGLVTSYIAAAVKAKVTLIETHKMGGDCLNYGCVPSKALIKSAKLAHQMAHAERYGLQSSTLDPGLHFKTVMDRVHATVRAVEPHDSVERYTNLGVDVVQGYATIIDPWTVEISHKDGQKQRLTSRNLVIATGASPFVPPLPGIEEVGYLTSDTLWEQLAQWQKIPEKMVVLGGGPIGCELAQSFARLGAHVTLVQRAARIMVKEDEEVSALARSILEADGVTVLTQHKAVRCEKGDAGKVLMVDHQDKEHAIPFDVLLCAVGRTARLQGYGLEELGIPTQRTVVTNVYMETLFPNILAAGDVAGPYQFTHTAAHQAWYAAVNALFGDFKKFKADYSAVPWTTFLDPEVARVGLNEQEAIEQNIPYEVTRFEMEELDRAIADSATQGFVKILTVPGKDRILGVLIVAEHAGDLLAEYVLAMRHGLGLNKILGTIHTYPTLAEANKYAAGEWKRAHAPQRLLAWVERYHAWKRG